MRNLFAKFSAICVCFSFNKNGKFNLVVNASMRRHWFTFVMTVRWWTVESFFLETASLKLPHEKIRSITHKLSNGSLSNPNNNNNNNSNIKIGYMNFRPPHMLLFCAGFGYSIKVRRNTHKMVAKWRLTMACQTENQWTRKWISHHYRGNNPKQKRDAHARSRNVLYVKLTAHIYIMKYIYSISIYIYCCIRFGISESIT